MALTINTIIDAISQLREQIAQERGEIELVKDALRQEIAKINEHIDEAKLIGMTLKAGILKPLISQAKADALDEIGELKEFIEEHEDDIRNLQSELRRATKRQARLN